MFPDRRWKKVIKKKTKKHTHTNKQKKKKKPEVKWFGNVDIREADFAAAGEAQRAI